MNKAKIRPIPFNRFVTVALAGLVAFLALMQGVLSVSGYQSVCQVQTTNPNNNFTIAIFELGIAAAAYLIFLLGARRLRRGWNVGQGAYTATIVTLLIGEGLLSFIFLRMSTCAG